MKKIVLVLAFLLIISFQLNAQWYWQLPKPQGNSLYSVWVLDSLNMLTVGENGTLLKTEDAGLNWQQKNQLENSTSILTGLQFISSNKGWCIDNHNLFKSTDGGNNWSKQEFGIKNKLNSVFFVDENNGWLTCGSIILFTKDGGITWDTTSIPLDNYGSIFFVTDNLGCVTSFSGNIYRTTNGGETWNLVESNFLHYYQDIFFLDNLRGWVVGSAWQFNSAFLSTNDGGLTWTEHTEPENFLGLNSVIFMDSLNGFITGSEKYLFRTSNGGETWEITANSFGRLLSVHSSHDGKKIWAVGEQGTLIASDDGGRNWTTKSTHIANFLYDIKFCNSKIGWAVGDKVVKTEDGGKHWTEQELPFASFISSVFVLDSLTAWCAGEYVFKTSDGGQSWISQSAPVNQTWFSIFFIDRNVGWISGRYGSLHKTTDGGVHWDSVTTGTNMDLGKVFFLDSLNGWMVGNGAGVWKSNDGGLNWSKITVPLSTPFMLWDIYFINSGIGFIVGESTILKTTNAGQNWSILIPPDNYTIFHKIKFINEQNGWASANTGIFSTTNGGLSWALINSPLEWTNSIDFFDSFEGWVVGKGGSILHTTNGGVTFIEDEKNIFTQPKNFLLHQNYPNPFNPSTKISWQSPVVGWQSLKVYDILGNEVATLVNEYRDAGSYEVDFKSSVGSHQLANGVYFYRLQVGDYVETRKMLLLK
jgi:photosystem II stability/assembly factor-like uncharacterized protein